MSRTCALVAAAFVAQLGCGGGASTLRDGAGPLDVAPPDAQSVDIDLADALAEDVLVEDALVPPDAGPPLPPIDPAFRAGYALTPGALAAIYPLAGDTSNTIAGQVGTGLAFDSVASGDALVRRVFASFSQHPDDPDVAQLDGAMASMDGGGSFGEYHRGIEQPPVFAFQLRNGALVSLGFVPTSATHSATESRLTIPGHTSMDEGRTWTPFVAIATVPRLGGSIGRLNGHFIQLADGTLLIEYYSRYAGDVGGYRSILLASRDQGRTFTARGSIAVPPAGRSYPEADVIELADGSLYAVFRHHADLPGSPGALAALRWARSTDGGVHWSAPADLRVAFGNAPAATRIGINPHLAMLPNGMLVLSSGRPDNFVAMSTGEIPVTWTQGVVTYVNHPTATSAGYGASVLRVHGSSGNTGLLVVDANRAMQIGDNCATGWGCPAADRGFTVDNRYRVWRRFIEVLTPDVGKIDLLGKLRRGAVTVETNLDYRAPAHPRARVEGAIDGSTDYWSSAVGTHANGTFTLHLDRTYELTRVGLAIRHGVPGNATVYTSLDGATWSAAPLITAARRTHRALEYFPLARPVAAAHVRVMLDTSAPCDTEIGAVCAFLNELELYATVDSFENDPVGAPPRGYRDVVGAWVTDYQTGGTHRALRLTDNSASTLARARWVGTPAPHKRFEFAVRPLSFGAGLLFDLVGRDASGADVAAYHLGVLGDGSVARFDAARAAWERLAPAGTVRAGTYARIEIDAALDTATIRVNDTVVGTVAPSTRGAVALYAHVFASGGTASVGDQYLIDDVVFR